MQPKLARHPHHPRKHAIHVTHVSMNSTPFLKLHINYLKSEGTYFLSI